MLPSLPHHHLHHHHLLLLLLLLTISTLIPPSHQQNSSCPLDFSVLNKFVSGATSLPSDNPTRCLYVVQALHLVQSQYLRTSSLFVPPLSSAASCWSTYERLVAPILPSGFDVRSSCGFQPEWISEGCMNITTRARFESLVPASARDDMRRNCGGSLLSNANCTPCTTSLNRVTTGYLPGSQVGNVSDCASYTAIYAGAVLNSLGPTDDGTALCLFLLNSSTPTPASSPSSGSTPAWPFGLGAACFVVLLAVLAIWFALRRHRRQQALKKRQLVRPENSTAMQSLSESTTLVKFKFEEIKAATKNFSRDNIIGRGGYGNVYSGVLADGSEVALKRFKNCSAAGDVSFAHEVEVIASVRHVNLVALRGYCTATTQLEGHQRIIVCDLMKNGSLHDHLFGSLETKLSWPIRQRIAIGMAKGLSYLHYGAQPSIIHRDIKASNILLDDRFEAMVADFGLAKFAPEGMSHMSTKVAGTLGYVAPEYALYGQLTEKSDVYSFGVVLLELLSGRKAFVSKGPDGTFLVTEWAWSLVRRGRTLDVIEDGMEELGPEEVVEKYVLTAVLASHPQMHARPTMDQIVKILETNVEMPVIPDRPIPFVAAMEDIERSVSSSGSGQLSSFAGYQAFLHGIGGSSSDILDVV